MRQRSKALLAACALACVVGCGRTPAPTAPPVQTTPPPEVGTLPIVAATIFPLADLTRQLAGDSAEVASLVPAGATPHTFSLGPQQARQLADAKLVVRVGPGFDDWLQGAIEGSSAPVLAVLEKTSLLRIADDHDHDAAGGEEHAHGIDDPHVWLDPIRVRDDIAPAIAAALIAALPEMAADVNRRLEALQNDLTLLDDEIRALLEPVASKRYIASHAAWNYLNERYGLTQAASIEIVPGAAPSARWRREVIETARREKVGSVFVEAQLSSAAAEAVARDAGLKVGHLDPLGGEGVEGRDSYQALMRYNAEQLHEGLSDG